MIVFFRVESKYAAELQTVTHVYNDAKYSDTFKSLGISEVTRISAGPTSTLAERIGVSPVGRTIVNEYTGIEFKRAREIRDAVWKAKQIYPIILFMWHVMFLRRKVADFYRISGTDYILIEAYWPWKWRTLLWLFFRLSWNVAHKAGILDRVLFVLGINDNEQQRKKAIKEGDLWHLLRWANDERTMRAQLEYIKKRCPGMAGIGFFVQGGSSWEAVSMADYLIAEYFNA